MIQPIQFKSNINQNPATVQPTVQENTKKFSLTETYEKAKKGTVDVFKNINNVTSVSEGMVKGAIEGGIVAAGFGILAKNLQESDGQLFGMLKGTISDCAHGAKKAICFLPKVITESPLENIKTIAKLPGKFTKNYLSSMINSNLISIILS